MKARCIRMRMRDLHRSALAWPTLRCVATRAGASISHRIRRTLLKQLHPDVAAAFDAAKLTRTCANELTHVKAERKKEILVAMEAYKDFSLAFARALILKTPPAQRESRSRKKEPWGKNGQRKSGVLKKLVEAEQKHDFYSRLYKQYTDDLLRLAVYARSLITNSRIRAYLDQHHAVVVERFERVIADAQE